MTGNHDPRQRLRQLQARLKAEVPPTVAGGSSVGAASEERNETLADQRLRSDADPAWQALYEGVRRSVSALRSPGTERER
ncbi:hypothetical protein PA598K_06039 [Paenibacillus sp. 598K]|uniref:hypothetical protein n=1 Tax=Paenibacillus sp. 598K TaxID=1117987 RepID=UPI000FF94CFB|nr:hypothetical protein [Paenibacillus sp. 598K]GBF77485.1 hypothetical protein PA598K_06039 [Paenibacillus sp. 598K]